MGTLTPTKRGKFPIITRSLPFPDGYPDSIKNQRIQISRASTPRTPNDPTSEMTILTMLWHVLFGSYLSTVNMQWERFAGISIDYGNRRLEDKLTGYENSDGSLEDSGMDSSLNKDLQETLF